MKAGSIASRVVVGTLRGYQRYISPLLPPRCRFYPTCSEYAVVAVKERGVIRGVGLAARRVSRCHPFHPGGYDPVPPGSRPAQRSQSQPVGSSRTTGESGTWTSI